MQNPGNRGDPDTMWTAGHDKTKKDPYLGKGSGKDSYRGMPLGIPLLAYYRPRTSLDSSKMQIQSPGLLCVSVPLW
jgi:hypothetical protein